MDLLVLETCPHGLLPLLLVTYLQPNLKRYGRAFAMANETHNPSQLVRSHRKTKRTSLASALSSMNVSSSMFAVSMFTMTGTESRTPTTTMMRM